MPEPVRIAVTAVSPAAARGLFEWIVALGPLAISGAVGVIALWQARLAKEKLRLDLYDRRFATYNALFDYYRALVGWENTPEQNATKDEFFKAYQSTQFLFSEESGINALYKRVVDYGAQVTGFKDHADEYRSDPPTVMTLDMRISGILTTGFDEVLSELRIKITPYLDFQKI